MTGFFDTDRWNEIWQTISRNRRRSIMTALGVFWGIFMLIVLLGAGMGLGRYLMTRLVKWSRGKKLERIYGDVMENNLPMLSLAKSLGFVRESQQDGLVRVSLQLLPEPQG